MNEQIIQGKVLTDIVLENENFILCIGADGCAKSLLHKASGEECLMQQEKMPMFSLTEERPYNNEIKLMHPNKRTVFQANSVSKEGDRLIVGFDVIGWKAVVEVKVASGYMSFCLVDYVISEDDFRLAPNSDRSLYMDVPPVYEFRLLQLPLKKREHFGKWLNVLWDSEVAVNVLATSPFLRIDARTGKDYVVMTADAMRDVKLKNCSAALIVSSKEELFDAIEAVEEDYDLPRGVKSRRSGRLNSSVYWTADANLANIDEHIAYAKQGGFRMMLFYISGICKDTGGWRLNGDYDFRDTYPNGTEDVKAMLQKVKAAGITPGLHFLHTHIGMQTRYVTPVADHRLHLTKYFTLAKELGPEDDVIYVEQNPEGAVMCPECRVLKFGGELISYSEYSTEFPYCFKGCVRGHWNTKVKGHEIGTIGGILDISEFGGTSVYLDQQSSLQDEIADKLANIYNAGFEFAYFDGSEGTNAPFEIYVPYAQYRVYRKFNKAPLFCEGAAKAHFSWHMLSGGNAFDVFPTKTFKEGIAQFPAREAPHMAEDFTRVDFGWWCYFEDSQPDTFEYGTSRAAAWDCPVTMQENRKIFQTNPRTADNLEVIRRWEDMRAKGLLTQEMKDSLKDTTQEHILLLNEEKEYELVPYACIKNAAGSDQRAAAFAFERKGRSYVVCWHRTGTGKLWLPLDKEQIIYESEIGGEKQPIESAEQGVYLELAGRRYVSSELPLDTLVRAFEDAKMM